MIMTINNEHRFCWDAKCKVKLLARSDSLNALAQSVAPPTSRVARWATRNKPTTNRRQRENNKTRAPIEFNRLSSSFILCLTTNANDRWFCSCARAIVAQPKSNGKFRLIHERLMRQTDSLVCRFLLATFSPNKTRAPWFCFVSFSLICLFACLLLGGSARLFVCVGNSIIGTNASLNRVLSVNLPSEQQAGD